MNMLDTKRLLFPLLVSVAAMIFPGSSIDAAPQKLSIEYSAEAAYTGQWYNNGAYYRGVTATFPSNQRPMGVYRSETNRTYFVWGNGYNPSWATIGAYDHATGQIVDVNKVYQFPDTDGHRNPTLMIDKAGYVYVFAGGHGGIPIVVKRSTTPYNITSWVSGANIQGTATYPQPHEMGIGSYALLYRAGTLNNSWAYSLSTDKFATATAPVAIVTPTGAKTVYALSEDKDGVIHMFWTVLDLTTQVRKNFWYARSTDGVHWTKSDGAPYSMPIEAETQGEQIFDSGADQVNTQDIIIDDNGNPVIMISHGPTDAAGVANGPWHYAIVKMVGGAWQSFDIPAAADRQFDSGALVYLSATDLRAILPSAPGQANEDGGNIEQWASADLGETWSLMGQLTNDPFNHNNVKTIRNAHPDFLAFWGYGDATVNKPGVLKFLGPNGVESVRPGNPYKRLLKTTVNGTITTQTLYAPAGINGEVRDNGITVSP